MIADVTESKFYRSRVVAELDDHRPVDWSSVRCSHPHGTLCVLRSSFGQTEALAVAPQDSWTEWPGVFCVL